MEKPWGVVYDAKTKLPIDPAIVTIAVHENGVGEFKQTRTTDIEGRFSFLVTPGRYVITAEKTNYRFPSKIVTGRNDGEYKNIYHGEVIEVENPYIINLNIPMDPVNFDWNQSIKHKPKVSLLTKIRNLFAEKLRLFSPKSPQGENLWGQVYYKYNHEPVPRITVKAIRLPHNLQIASTTTDHLGRYFLLLAQGKYTIQVEDEKPQVLARLENVQVTKPEEIINFDIGI